MKKTGRNEKNAQELQTKNGNLKRIRKLGIESESVIQKTEKGNTTLNQVFRTKTFTHDEKKIQKRFRS